MKPTRGSLSTDGCETVVHREGPLSPALPVELPGIEPVAEIGVTCEDAESDDAKARESTCGYARDVDAINRPQPQLVPQIEQRNAGPHPPARRRVPIPTVLSSLRMRSAVQFAASTNALDAIIRTRRSTAHRLRLAVAALSGVGKDEVVVTPRLKLRAGL